MININNVTLAGRLTKDPELRKTQSNLSVVSFTVAVDRPYSKDKKEADFINCIAWRQSADFLAKYAKKGDIVAVEGSIATRNYQNEAGKKVYVTEVSANSVQMIGSQKESATSDDEINIYKDGEIDTSVFEKKSVGKLDTDELPFY